MDHTVFISYSSSDKAVAEQICSSLEGAGIGCWIAPRDIPPGADYPAAILAGIQGSSALVVVVSASAVTSPHILTEVGHAFSAKRRIIPFRLSAADLPADLDYFLSMSQWLDASGGVTPENLARLKDVLSRPPQRTPAADPVRGSSPGSTNTGTSIGIDIRVVGMGVALLLVIIAAIAFFARPSHDGRKGTASEAKSIPPVDTKGDNGGDSGKGKTGGPPAKPEPWVNPKDGLSYVWIPPGQFVMGCSPGDTECQPDESPTHPVEIPKGYWLGQTEVTNAAYQRTVKTWKFAAGDDKLPAVNISWAQAKSYCAAIGGRLPTEAEWEYAARGGLTTAYYGVPSKIAWYEANSDGKRHEVGKLQPNPFGLYDVLGNASEWVLDRYYNKYDVEAPANGKVDEPIFGNSSAVARGGYWESPAANIRVSRRSESDNRDPVPMVGIRCIAEKN